MFKLYLLAIAITSSLALPKSFADNKFTPEILPGSQEVVLGGKNGKEPQRHKKLRIASLPQLHTTVLYTQNGLVFPTEKAVLITLAGTGGNPAMYGIANSMTKVANAMLKFEVNTLAFENPLYDRFDEPGFDRTETINHYQNISSQMDWLYDVVTFVVERVEKLHGPDTHIPILVAGRSTGSALWQEAYHRYLLGDPRARIIGKISMINVWGINGHSPRDIARWTSLERETFDSHADSEDPLVVKASKFLFEHMSWQSGLIPEDLKGDLLSRPAPDSGPTIVPVVSMKDAYSTQEDQLRVLSEFGQAHPGAKVLVYQLGTGHDPSAGYSETDQSGNVIKREPMEMVKPILLDEVFNRIHVPSGVHILPEHVLVPNLECAIMSELAPVGAP